MRIFMENTNFNGFTENHIFSLTWKIKKRRPPPSFTFLLKFTIFLLMDICVRSTSNSFAKLAAYDSNQLTAYGEKNWNAESSVRVKIMCTLNRTNKLNRVRGIFFHFFIRGKWCNCIQGREGGQQTKAGRAKKKSLLNKMKQWSDGEE